MATLEAMVATRLRADTTLMAILLGGVYAIQDLPTAGITDPKQTPGVYAAGLLKPTGLVRERGEVDDPRIFDELEQVVAESIVVEVWLYQRIASDAITAAKGRIYTLLQGYKFTRAWPASRVFTLATMSAPEFTGVKVGRVDYQIRSLRKG